MKIYIRLSTFTLDPSLPFRINLWQNNVLSACRVLVTEVRGRVGAAPRPPARVRPSSVLRARRVDPTST